MCIELVGVQYVSLHTYFCYHHAISCRIYFHLFPFFVAAAAPFFFYLNSSAFPLNTFLSRFSVNSRGRKKRKKE